MSILEEIKEEVKYLLEEFEGVHNWDHIERVYNLAIHIGKVENADLEILGISSLLHDIGRPEEIRTKGQVCHAEIGAILAENILQKYNLSEEKIEKIKHCILTHRFSKGKTPESKEAKILYDADKLDNVGAIGIARSFVFSGKYDARVHNPEVNLEDIEAYSKEDTAYTYYHIKLKKIKDKLFTKEAKRIAEERSLYMKEFFERLGKECTGEL